MDDNTLDHLLVTAANPDIAKEYTTANLSKELEAIASRPGVVPYMKQAAQRVINRLHSWEVLFAIIWAPNSSFILAREVLHNLGSDESSFSVALHVFVTHPDLATTVAEVEGLIKLCTWVGVACLLAAYTWADSAPN